jgi:transcriptional regulator with XRE-family HTH domain
MSTRILKSWRAKKGLSIRNLDEQNLLSVSGNTYNKYENNPGKIELDFLYEIVDVFGGDINEFFNAFQQDKKSQNKK